MASNFLTPEDVERALGPSGIKRSSVFTRSKAESQYEFEKRSMKTVKVPDPEKVMFQYVDDRPNWTPEQLNTTPEHYHARPAVRSKDIGGRCRAAIEAHAFKWTVPYRNIINNKYETHKVVAVKLHHGKNDLWEKVAVVCVEQFDAMCLAGVPVRWSINGAKAHPVARVRVYGKSGGTTANDLNLARYMMSPPLDMYLRFQHAAQILIPSNFAVKSPRGKKGRRMVLDVSPRERLAEHCQIAERERGAGWLDLVDPSKYLIDPRKVDFKYLAYWVSKEYEAPELFQEGVEFLA